MNRSMTGQAVAHYQVLEKLGEGGMGVVYKARDTHLDRFVAIKVLPPERVTDPERKRRFVQEAKAASALNHPNIIHIYDISNQGGVDFIAMEYVAGKTLYCTKGDGPSPLFAKRPASGPQRHIPDSVVARGVIVVEDGIYHIARADKDGAYPLQFFDLVTGKSRVLTRIETRPYWGLTVSPDRRTVLFTVAKPINYDLMLIENFR